MIIIRTLVWNDVHAQSDPRGLHREEAIFTSDSTADGTLRIIRVRMSEVHVSLHQQW